MSEITRRITHWEVMRVECNKANHLGRYIPAGLHKCQLCQTYDDPRRVSVHLENHVGISMCWTCAEPHLRAFLETVLDPEELDETNDQSGIAFPRDPRNKKDDPPKLPENHPKVIQEAIATETETKSEEAV